MAETRGISKLSGRAGSILLPLGILTYFSGILGFPRMLLFVGVGLIVLSIAAFFIEEFGPQS